MTGRCVYLPRDFVVIWELYDSLGEWEPSLIEVIEEYDKKAKRLYDSLSGLTPEDIERRITEEAPDFRAELEKIKTKLLQIWDKYRRDYCLTIGEIGEA